MASLTSGAGCSFDPVRRIEPRPKLQTVWEKPQGPVPHLSRIKLRRFEPGNCELRVTVFDRNAHAIASRTVGFTVD